MNGSNEYTFERVTNAHYPLLQVLFADAFHQNISIEEISKRFNTVTLGAGLVGFIAIHAASQKPAAYYGVFPLQLLVNDQVTLAAQSGDTMTHSEHRKKGLFVQLATLTYDTCKQEGIYLLYGSPNSSSYTGLVQNLKWEHRENIIRYDLKLNFKTLPLPKILSAHKNSQSLYFKYARLVLKNHIVAAPEAFHHPGHPDHTRVYRNKAYIHYKSDAAKFFIRIDDIIFWIKLSDVLWIGDLSDYKQITAATLSKLKRLAFLLGYNTIVMNLNEQFELPPAFSEFKPHDKDAACYKLLEPVQGFEYMIWTGADFDTW